MENISQIPNVQPVEPTQSVSPIKNQNIFKILFIASLFVIFGIIIAFYLVLNNKINQLSNKQIDDITSVPTKQTITTNNEITPTSVPIIASTESTLVEKDANNNLYTNNKFGFSLTIPKAIIQSSCQKNQDLYTLLLNENEEVPLSFFENGDTIYLSGSYFYRLTGEQKIAQSDGGYMSKYSDCGKITTTFEQANNNDNFSLDSLKIYTSNVKNDGELEKFIKSKFGSSCRLGEKILSTSSKDTYSVKILSDGKDLGESQCPINFAIDTKYNPNKGKVVIFELGQDCSLFTKNSQKCNELEISNSLKFL